MQAEVEEIEEIEEIEEFDPSCLARLSRYYGAFLLPF